MWVIRGDAVMIFDVKATTLQLKCSERIEDFSCLTEIILLFRSCHLSCKSVCLLEILIPHLSHTYICVCGHYVCHQLLEVLNCLKGISRAEQMGPLVVETL